MNIKVAAFTVSEKSSNTFSIIALSIDIPMVNAKGLEMHKVERHVDPISKLLYGFVCRGDNPVAIVRRLSSHTDAKNIQ